MTFSTPVTPIAITGNLEGYHAVYDSAGTDSHSDYWLYKFDDLDTTLYPDLSHEIKLYYNDTDGARYSVGGQSGSTVVLPESRGTFTDPYFGSNYSAAAANTPVTQGTGDSSSDTNTSKKVHCNFW